MSKTPTSAWLILAEVVFVSFPFSTPYFFFLPTAAPPFTCLFSYLFGWLQTWVHYYSLYILSRNPVWFLYSSYCSWFTHCELLSGRHPCLIWHIPIITMSLIKSSFWLCCGFLGWLVGWLGFALVFIEGVAVATAVAPAILNTQDVLGTSSSYPSPKPSPSISSFFKFRIMSNKIWVW